MKPDTPGVFLSYARSDGSQFAARIREQLLLEKIEVWRDIDDMVGGWNWRAQIEEALARVDTFLLFLTDAAISSEHVAMEWRMARRSGVRIIPVWRRPYPNTSFLPRCLRDAHAVDVDAPEQWQRLLSELRTPTERHPVPFMAGALPPNYVERQEVHAVLAALRTADHATVGLKGAPGFGKSIIATAVCQTDEAVEEFDAGILWLTIGPSAHDLLIKAAGLVERLTGKTAPIHDEDSAGAALAEALSERRYLLVLDDVWRARDLDIFLRGGPNTARLMTTRDGSALPPQCVRIEVDAAQAGTATAILGWQLPAHPGVAELAHKLGDWPLLLTLVNAQIRRRLGLLQPMSAALDAISSMLTGAGVTAFDARNPVHRNDSIRKAVVASLEQLDDADRDYFIRLVVFPDAIDIPIETLGSFWQLDRAFAEDVVLRLRDASLLQRADLGTGEVRLHAVLRGALQSMHGDQLAGWHEELVARMKPDSPYYWHRIAYHLDVLNRRDELWGLMRDVSWLEAKITATDVTAAINDCSYLAENVDAQRLRKALVLSARVLARDPMQLAGQLAGRLSNSPMVGRPARPHLRPITRSLAATHGPRIRVFDSHRRIVTGISISPDDRRAVSCSLDGVILLWDLTRQSEARQAQFHGVYHLSFLPDSRHFVSATPVGKIQLWNADEMEVRATFDGPPTIGRIVALDSTSVLVQPDQGPISQWSLTDGRVLRSFELPDDRAGAPHLESRLDLVASGITTLDAHLLAWHNDHGMAVWEFESGYFLGFADAWDPVATMKITNDFPLAVGWRPGSNFMLSARGQRGMIDVWEFPAVIHGESSG